jgi:hypothetical protein
MLRYGIKRTSDRSLPDLRGHSLQPDLISNEGDQCDHQAAPGLQSNSASEGGKFLKTSKANSEVDGWAIQVADDAKKGPLFPQGKFQSLVLLLFLTITLF